ncbi:hypothetical protein ACSG7K_002024 [Vibrio cholerae]|nr:hypothetical protein [Vibrio cholerae]EGR4324681.1 hypothetical protein [Vibrio cholerae]EKF9130516.1 hypothetical protein [Vibrio cholerae]EKF9430474.1 hypothetical protein [Vibrio cholerae]EKF9788571.1 hypothetical protein [Vibrio cholerae]
MEFNFPPQNLAEVFGFFAVMFIVMLAFYFFGQWLHSTGHGPRFHIHQTDYGEAVTRSGQNLVRPDDLKGLYLIKKTILKP